MESYQYRRYHEGYPWFAGAALLLFALALGFGFYDLAATALIRSLVRTPLGALFAGGAAGIGDAYFWNRWRHGEHSLGWAIRLVCSRLVDAPPRLAVWRGLCLTLGLIALVLGTAGPQWGRD